MMSNVDVINALARFTHDPFRFVYFAFSWGDGSLEGKTPSEWQVKELKAIRDGFKSAGDVIRTAVASGHGIGKSALVAWLVLWAISTREDTRGIVTANTETQLITKTWAELSKWYSLFIGKDLFKITATSIFSAQNGKEKTWRIDAIPWSKDNPEAFAGLHNQGNRILLIFDEASSIDNRIWEVAEGAMTDDNTEIIWSVFGNPTRNTGRFFDCFHKYRKFWKLQQVDSRDVPLSNKATIEQWQEMYGEDSDFFRVRVMGQFPQSGTNQLIPTSLVEESRKKKLQPYMYDFAPVVIGCDPAWSGDDYLSIWMRQGLCAKRLAKIPKNDNDLTIANMLCRFEDEYKAAAVNIDMGYGTGIYSAGVTMGRNWNLISFAAKPPVIDCTNMRSYMWKEILKWLKQGGALPDEQSIQDDLTGVEIKPTLDGKLQLQSKEYMKKKGIPSPNDGDALALTFAVPVARSLNKYGKVQHMTNTEYSIF
jgi:hypothetical protein